MINLKEVITKYPECLESASKLRSYLVDIYPEEKARIRIIIDSFDCGVYEKIKNADIVDKLLISGFYNTLEKDYGYTHTLSEWCVNEWLQVLGKESLIEKNDLTCEIETPIENIKENNIKRTNYIYNQKEDNNVVYENKTKVEASDFQTKVITLNNKKNLIITKYIGFESHKISVPNMIDGIPVVSIGESAFENVKSSEIYISDFITKLGRRAFKNCGNLNNIRLPKTLKEIDEETFYGCSSLCSINLNNVQIIGERAFNWCYSLNGIHLPDSLTKIGSSAFAHCSRLDYLEIPKTVKTLPWGIVQDCFALKYLILNDGVKKIEGDILSISSDKRFQTVIRIPNSVTSIDYTAFPFFNNSSIEFVCDRGSTALIYAREHNIRFEEYQGVIKLKIEQAQRDERLRNTNIKQYRQQQGLCPYCGGQFKGLLFKRCSSCGKPKDY